MGRRSWTDVATRSLPAYSTACRPKGYQQALLKERCMRGG
jgi:hypothetical protein